MDTNAVSPKYRKKYLMSRTCTVCKLPKYREKFVIRRNDKGPLVCRECEHMGEMEEEQKLEQKRRDESWVFYRIEPGSFSVHIRTDGSPIPEDFKPF